MPSINITFTNTSSFVPAQPSQRTSIGDFTNPSFRRYCYLTGDSLTLIVYTSSVVIPLLGPGGLYAAAISASSALSWPPIIITQPNSSSVTHPTKSFFVVSASAETPITYNWFSQSYSQSLSGVWSDLADGTSYTGSATNALTHSNTSIGDFTSSYFCALSDASGVVSSSTATLTVN